MKSFFSWIFRAIAGVILLILAFTTGWTLVKLPVAYENYPFMFPVFAGFCTGVVLFTLVRSLRLVPIYVAGHEFLHWIVAKLFRRKTGKFSVRAKAGSVEIEKPNIWIVLAPYVLPLFTLVWIGLYGVLRVFYDQPLNRVIYAIVFGGVGLTYAHHLVLTFRAISRSQPDFGYYGLWVSLPAVVWGNLLLLLGALMLVSRQWQEGVRLFFEHLGAIAEGVLRLCVHVFRLTGA